MPTASYREFQRRQLSNGHGKIVETSNKPRARGMRRRRQTAADRFLLLGIIAMADSTIAVAAFGGDKTLLATDQNASAHTIKVTTDDPTDGIAIWGAGTTKYVIGTVADGGVHTLCVTTDAPNSAILLNTFGAGATKIGTVLSDGVHVLCVTTDAANAAVPIDAFGMGATAIATVLADDVHVLAVTDTPDSGFAVSSFASGKSVIAAARNGLSYSLALSGLAPPYDPEAAAYFAAAGITDPNAQDAINAFIVGVKADFAITMLTDVFDQLILQANESAAAAVVDMCGNVNQILVNDPTFTQWQGVKNSATAYIDSGYNPLVNAINLQQENFSYGGYVRGPSSGRSLFLGSINSGFGGYQIAPNNDDSHIYASTGGLAAIETAIPASGQTGFWLASRTATDFSAAYAEGIQIGTTAGSTYPSFFLSQNFYLLARNYEGTPSIPTLNVEGCLSFFARGLSDSEVAALNARVQILRAAIGW